MTRAPPKGGVNQRRAEEISKGDTTGYGRLLTTNDAHVISSLDIT